MQRDDQNLISLTNDLKKYTELLAKEAGNYCSTIQLNKLNEEQLIAYNVFYHAFHELLNHLRVNEVFTEDKKLDDEKKEAITTAIEISLDSITLFRELAETQTVNDITYNQDQLNKISAINQYQEKYQHRLDSASSSGSNKFNHVIHSVAAGALGFLLGVGIAVGLGFAIASANPMVLIAIIGIGGWFLGITGTIVGFRVPSWCHWIADSQSQTTSDQKAISFVNQAATFFSSSRSMMVENAAAPTNVIEDKICVVSFH